MLKTGQTIQELSFQTSDGQAHTLESLKDAKAVIVFFYPSDFTPGCTKEVCHFRDIYQELREEGAQIFGVSLDGDDSHERFREQHNLPFALISDESKTLSTQFDVLRLGGLLKVRRATFVINPRTGQIVDAFSSELNMNKHGDRVLENLKNWNEDTAA